MSSTNTENYLFILQVRNGSLDYMYKFGKAHGFRLNLNEPDPNEKTE